MKVVQLKAPGGLDQISIVDKPMPSPAAGEVLVKWHASSLNYHDYLVAIGGIKTENNRILLSDGAGEVKDIGKGVTAWKPGDKVMSMFFPHWVEGEATADKLREVPGDLADGFSCEYSCVMEHALTAIPADYSYAEAATLPCAALTAWRALIVEGRIKAGDQVLVEGTGGMSIFALQIAKAAGAKVFATSSSDEKMKVLTKLGADVVLNYKTDPDWDKKVRKQSGGGVDVVVDAGGGATINQSIKASRIGGKVILVGVLGGAEAKIIVPSLFFKQQKLAGIAVGSRKMQEDMIRGLEVNRIKPVIDSCFKLDKLADAFRHQKSGKHFGKIVIEY
ncbi:MAG: NAD(P)-dependent alcohol dehydrogenase [bacterium]